MPPSYGVQTENQILEIQTLSGTNWELSGFGWAGQPAANKPEVHYICFGRHPEVSPPPAGQAPAKTRWRSLEVGNWAKWKAKVNAWVAANSTKNYLYFRGCVTSRSVASTDTWATVTNVPACSFAATAAKPDASDNPGLATLAPQIFTGYVNVVFDFVRKATIISLASTATHPRASIEVWTTFDDGNFPKDGPYEMSHALHWPIGVDFDVNDANSALTDTWQQVGGHAGAAYRHTVRLESSAMKTKPF